MIRLFDWQQAAAARQLAILREKNLALNLSSTGIGKTFMTAWGLRELGLPVLTIAPKSVLSGWKDTLDQAEVETDGIINWESLKTGKHPWWNGTSWKFSRKMVVVVDEVQRGASGANAKATNMLAMLRAYPIPKVLLSATLAATPLALRGVGFLAGLHQFNDASFYDWCLRMGCVRMRRLTPHGYVSTVELPRGPKGQEAMARIYHSLSSIMVRLTPENAPGFPDTTIVSKLFDVEDALAKDVDREYAAAAEAVKGKHDDPLSLLMRARRKSEIIKVPILKDLVQESVCEGRSVVVFLNFRETMQLLSIALGESNLVQIHGSQTALQRDAEIASFQANEKFVCLAQVMAGGVGVSLHDVHGVRPRTAYISPSYSVSDMVQCMGRVRRAGGTKSLQMFVLLRGTAEERIHRAITQKQKCLDALTTGELWGVGD